MKLDTKQREILRACLNRQFSSIDELARLVPYRPHAIRYCLNQLRERNVINRFIVLNPCRLGYMMINIFFSIAEKDARKTKAILDEIAKYKAIQWLAEITGGKHRFELTIQVRNLHEMKQFFDLLMQKNQCSFENKIFAIEWSHSYFGEKYISSSSVKIPTVSFEDNGSIAEIDDIDRGILRFMQEGRGDSDAEIARKLKVPLSTFTYRKDRLKEAGVIVAEVYRLNWNDAERYIYCALVSVSRLTTQFNDQFQKFCRDHRNVVL